MQSKRDVSEDRTMDLEKAFAEIALLREELHRAKVESAQVSKMKDDFLSRISHELRTPLNAIMGIGELMQSTGLSEMQAKYLNMISESTSQLLRLVNEILDFSELQGDESRAQPEEFLFRDTFEPAFVQFRLKARNKGLDLFVHVDRDLPEAVFGFPRWIFQIMSCLVDNAIKFTDFGEVLVRLYVMECRGNDFTLCLSVTDTGIGVAKQDQERIFQKFVTAHDSKKYGGIGMGLALAEKLAGKMNGRIWVDSELYLGSTFYVSLPMTKAVRPELGTKAVSNGPFHILLAEDEPVNQFTTVQLLSKQGHRIEAVDNGRLALEALARERYDLVLMDVSMPEMDGLEATRAIRSGKIKNVDPHIPIIALTALVMPTDKQRCLEAGMTAYVAKPVETQKLQEVMTEVVSRSRGE